MDDLQNFSTLQILALTAIGESEELGEIGMQQTINTVMNRVAANLGWMGGNDVRHVCLQKGQYDCWDMGTEDRERIVSIGMDTPTYAPYLTATRLAASALTGALPDITAGSVSYVDGNARACVHPGSKPHLIVGKRKFYDLKAVA